jgi:hypothetical protein
MLRRPLVRSALSVLAFVALASCSSKTTSQVLLSGGVPIEVKTGYLDTTTSSPTFVESATVAVGQQLALQVSGDPGFTAGQTLELRYSLTDGLKEPPSVFTVGKPGTVVVIPIALVEAELPYGRVALEVTVHTRRQARVDAKDRERNVGEGASVTIVGP